MALDATRMVNKGHLIHTDVKQFIDLLTGVMTDQAVTLNNDVFAAELTVGGTLAVYGGPSTFMFGASMSSGAWTGNGTVPPGGASGQVLSKSAAGDYAVAWTTPATGVTWPLLAPDGSAAAPSYAFASNSGTGIYSNGVALGITTGGTFRAFFGGSISFNAPLQFSTDNTYDIGAPSSARPRSIYAMTSVSGGSGTTLTTIGQSAASGAYLVGSNFGGVILGSASTAYFSMSASNFAPFTDNTKDLGTSSQRMKDGYFAGTLTVTTAFVGPGAVPTGGTAGQVLSKVDATNYNLAWITPSTGVSWPLLAPNGSAAAPSYSFAAATATGMFSSSGILTLTAASTINIQAAATFNIQFWTGGTNRWRIDSTGILAASSDNLYDIGATASSRPRDFYLGRNEFIGGNSQITGTVGIGTAPVTYSGLIFQPTMSGVNQFALYAPLTFSTTGTGNTFVFYTLPTYAASTRTVASGASFYADTPTLGAGVTVTGMYGLFVGNQGRSGVTNAYGIYINPQSGATTNNVAIQTNGPVNVFGGRTNFGGTNSGDQHYFILFATTPPPTSGLGGMLYSDQTGLRIEYWGNSLATSSVTGMFSAVLGGAGGVKTSFANGIQIGNPGNQGGGIGTSTGLRIDNVVSGSDNNYEIWLGIPSGATGDNKSIVFGNSGEYIRNPKNAVNNLCVESSDGYVMVSSLSGSHLSGNAYWDGSSWQRYNTGANSAVMSVSGPSAFVFMTAVAGSNPITLASVATIDNLGNANFIGSLSGASLTVAGYLYFVDGNSYLVRASTDLYIRTAGQFFFQALNGGFSNTLQAGTIITNTYLMLTGFNGMSGAISGLVYYHPNLTVYSYLDGGNGYHFANLTLVATAFTPVSARKLKTNIIPLADPISLVLDDRVHGVRYTEIASGAPRVGFVADDWARVEPSLVSFDHNDEVESLDYDRIGAITFEALKQHVIQTNTRLDALEAKLAA